MKKLLALLAMFSMVVFIACEDDEDDPVFEAPTVTAPSAVNTLENGETGVTATFTVSVDPELTATYSTTAENATITAGGSGDVSGTSIEVTFDAGTTAGAASITLTVTDSEGNSDSDKAVFTVNAPGDAGVSLSGIPDAAELPVNGTLAVAGVAVDAADGLASFTASVNGGSAVDLSGFDNGDGTYDIEFTTAELGAVVGTNTIDFVATDADGDVASFRHVLTVIDEVPVSSNISGDVTWLQGNTYILQGRITVLDGGTLTIEGGVIVKGESGTGANATALLVARGGTLNANGTASAPIIFTSIADEIAPSDVEAGNFASPNLDPDVNGLWGGVIVLGNAPISASDTEVQIEGIPTSDTNGLYGGSDAADNSGTISYISIRHGGANIGEGNEINGLTLGGVGTGTTISNVEVVANQDDGIEWFGGDVSIDNILIWNCGDDGLDTDQDWQGTASNFLIVTPDGSGFELDGPEGPAARDNGAHQFNTGTVYAGSAISSLVDWDDNTNAGVSGVYFYGLDSAYAGGIASFGGDGNGTTNNWEATLNSDDPNMTLTSVFGAEGAAITTERANIGAATVGVLNDDDFKWTWPGSEGILDDLGL